MGYQKVLVPVSGKYRMERSMLALEQALHVVREDGEICFLHCMDAVPYLLAGEEYKKLTMGSTIEAERLLSPLVERALGAGIKYSIHIMEGSPVNHIPRFALEAKCNIIVMYSAGRNEFDKLMGGFAQGSITERVLHASHVPLLIVH